MNCVNHQEVVAVASCSHCGVGLCKECVGEFLKSDNKPLCKECSLKYVDEGLKELQEELSQLKTKKIIWSILLIVGLAALALTEIPTPNGGGVFFACLIWSIAGFFDRAKRKIEYEKGRTQQSVMRDAMMERDAYNDGSIWIVWLFKLLFALIRGMFFPIFYAILMISGDKEIQSEIARLTELKVQLG